MKTGIKKEERKIIYPLIIFTPLALTVVFILNHFAGEKDSIGKWGCLAIIWGASIALIARAEYEIRHKSKKKSKKA